MTFSQEDRFIGRAARIVMAILAITFTTGQGISFSQERGLSPASTASGNGASRGNHASAVCGAGTPHFIHT